MARLLIANDSYEPEQIFENHVEHSNALAMWAMRILWHVNDNDIVVLPVEPDTDHLEYIVELLNVQHNSLKIIIAPEGSTTNLGADRITNPELYKTITKALSGQSLTSVIPLTPDAAVATLAHSLDAKNSFQGAGFASQNGGLLANSKAAFRALAAGVCVPIPVGFVINNSHAAEAIITDMLLNQKIAVIVKKDFGQGCRGNEILSPIEDLIPIGGRRGLVLTNPAAIKAYIAKNWSWLTNNGHNSIIVEHYFPNSMAIFVEFNLTNHAIKFAGLGEMLAAPIADGQVIPPVGLSPTTIAELVAEGYRLSTAIHAIGYRGTLSADAIVTPNGAVLFNEYNGRITGSTHIYASIGARIVGKDWMQKRILLERRGWKVHSFKDAANMLKTSGLAFNHKTKTGIILTGTFIPARGVISYTVVAEDLTAALNIEKQLLQVSPRAVEPLTLTNFIEIV